jgi:hypothetical protein
MLADEPKNMLEIIQKVRLRRRHTMLNKNSGEQSLVRSESNSLGRDEHVALDWTVCILDVKQIVEAAGLTCNINAQRRRKLESQRLECPRPAATVQHATFFWREAHSDSAGRDA